jgi:hypothetical protein
LSISGGGVGRAFWLASLWPLESFGHEVMGYEMTSRTSINEIGWMFAVSYVDCMTTAASLLWMMARYSARGEQFPVSIQDKTGPCHQDFSPNSSLRHLLPEQEIDIISNYIHRRYALVYSPTPIPRSCSKQAKLFKRKKSKPLLYPFIYHHS